MKRVSKPMLQTILAPVTRWCIASGIVFGTTCYLADPVGAQASKQDLPPRESQPSWLSNSGSRRIAESNTVKVEAGQDVLVDRLNADDDVVRRSAPPSVVILQERSSGQQFILNPGQDIALVLPAALIEGSRFEGLRYPLSTIAPVSSGFGMRVHPITGLANYHQGIDLAAPAGTPVLAAYSGQVVAAGPAGNLGNAVVIAHDTSRRTRYGHMSKVAVQANTWVEQGQVIGFVGSTGRSTGPHLHFEYWLRQNGSWTAIDISEQLRLIASGERSPSASGSSPGRLGIGGN